MALSTPAAPDAPAAPAALAIPDEKLLPSLLKYCFSEWMRQTLQRKPGFGD
jgi:hypothetical protein